MTKERRPKMKTTYVDLYGMIDLVGVKEDDEESGDLIKYARENNIKISKAKEMGFGDHRFTGPKDKLEELKEIWYPEEI